MTEISYWLLGETMSIHVYGAPADRSGVLSALGYQWCGDHFYGYATAGRWTKAVGRDEGLAETAWLSAAIPQAFVDGAELDDCLRLLPHATISEGAVH